ncbi:MAG: helix-turn-helix transcriptional regulator [Turicibacter sp.]|nr:helix-turn-helix transcriptional regulator [Turicibacter sp.]
MKNSEMGAGGISGLFKERRLAFGYSYEDLASLLNDIVGGVGKFSAQEIEAWETGDVDLKNRRIFALAMFFGIDAGSVMKDVQVKEKK